MERIRPRHAILIILLAIVTMFKTVPGLGNVYTFHIYPAIARFLSKWPNIIPIAVGDIFITASVIWVIAYPIYAITFKKKRKLSTLVIVAEYLLWVYVWFYAAWGLNYSQANIYNRVDMRPVEVDDSTFRTFAYHYADSLNATYAGNNELLFAERKVSNPLKCLTHNCILQGYSHLHGMGINRPFNNQAHAKTMMFSRLSSMAGITGSMAPFFCEFTLNADVLPHEYPATYAHEYAHFLGIANEGEANFYSYIACTSSSNQAVRFSGYYQIFFHVLRNVRGLLGEAEYEAYLRHISPEIIRLAKSDRKYWLSRHNTIIDSTQNFFYNLYLKGNRVEGGTKSYSGVIGIIMAWEGKNSFHNGK